jgi:nicotinamidase-related amidase
MSRLPFPQSRTAVLLVDPYNDFLSEGGKIWPLLRDVATKVGLVDNLRRVVRAARVSGTRIFIAPHRRWQPGDLESWSRPNPYQLAAARAKTFERHSWGGTFHPDFTPQAGDVVVKEHWGSSGFANTDLDLQLKQHDIASLVVIGLIANTCIECTSRFAVELGYHVTLVRDATAAMSDDAMRAAHEINGPTYAHAIVTTAEIVEALELA